ncbi:recombinase family protein [Ammoniphilus sp. CFH 90114]|uniref:recombinase family protein n=1 Tax=Ammoniphilus sp. CFH 90114 TaxID=2493665 RepID=UPI00100EE9FC|nr:recombinase family protein [Ammoniphilus sp. CFH 90114]RXT03558.1 recombinase family protein [Ammoniphilus sp. CFH 90114]
MPKIAEDEGCIVVDVLVEEISAYDNDIDDRPVLKELLKRALQGEFDVVVCWQKTRLVRDMHDEILIKNYLIDQAGCQIIFSDPAELPYKPDDSLNRMMHMMKGYLGEVEVENLRERIKAHLRARAGDGRYVGGTYTGYEWNKHTKRMEQVPSEIDIVRKIFNWYLYEGYSTTQISNLLNLENARTKNNKKFYPYTVCSILQNKIYCGYYRWGFTTSKRRSKPIPTEGFEMRVKWIDPIISLEEWDKVQKIMVDRSGKKRGQKRDYSRVSSSIFLLSGKVFCGSCGNRMAAHNGSKTYDTKKGIERTSEYLRYICRNKEVSHMYKKQIDSKVLDQLVYNHVLEFVQSANKDLMLIKAKQCLEDYTKEIRYKILNMKKFISNKEDESENIKTNMFRTSNPELVALYESQYLNNQKEIESKEKAVKELENGLREICITEKDVDDFLDFISSFDESEVYPREKIIRLFDTLVERVIVTGDEVIIKIKWAITMEQISIDDLSPVEFELKFVV